MSSVRIVISTPAGEIEVEESGYDDRQIGVAASAASAHPLLDRAVRRARAAIDAEGT